MEITQLIEVLDKLNVSKKFIANWNNAHKGKNIVHFMNNISIEAFAMKFNDATFSFIWSSTPEGMLFWRYVDIELQTIVFPNKTKIVKQAILRLKKYGYTTGMLRGRNIVGIIVKYLNNIGFWQRFNLPNTADVDDSDTNPKLIVSTTEYLIKVRLYHK